MKRAVKEHITREDQHAPLHVWATYTVWRVVGFQTGFEKRKSVFLSPRFAHGVCNES